MHRLGARSLGRRRIYEAMGHLTETARSQAMRTQARVLRDGEKVTKGLSALPGSDID
jgi:hypothetical protein